MTLDLWSATPVHPNRDLLKDQTVYANLGVRMNDDAVWMIYEQPTTNVTIQGDISARNHAPKPVSQSDPLAKADGYYPRSAAPMLISSNCQEKFAAGVPKLPRLLPAPIGNVATNESFITIGWRFDHILYQLAQTLTSSSLDITRRFNKIIL